MRWNRVGLFSYAKITPKALKAKEDHPWETKYVVQECLSLLKQFEYWVARPSNQTAHDITQCHFKGPPSDMLVF